MDPITIISLILTLFKLVQAIPEIVEFFKMLWGKIAGVRSPKVRKSFRRRAVAAVRAHLSADGKSLDQQKCSSDLFALSREVDAYLEAQTSEARQKLTAAVYPAGDAAAIA